MKWTSSADVTVDRHPCSWRCTTFMNREAVFLRVPADQIMPIVPCGVATPYAVERVELGHHAQACSVEAIPKHDHLTDHPALVFFGTIVAGADTDHTLYQQPEGRGLEVIAEGFRHLGSPDGHAIAAAKRIVYDAPGTFSQELVQQGKPEGMFTSV